MKPFLLLAELVPAQADDVRSIERFLLDYAARKTELQSEFRLAGITLPQNPRGNPMLDPADIYTLIAAKNPPENLSSPSSSRGLWADLEVIPHLTGKEQNIAALRSTLMGYRALGLTSVLAITGDKPSPGKRVFEVDSIGLLRLMADMNFDAYQRTPVAQLASSVSSGARASRASHEPQVTASSAPPSLPEILAGRDPAGPSSRPSAGFASVPQFFSFAAVSPFKYTEASLVQQYFKLGKKIRAGAGAILMQMGWDSRKSEELFRYLREARLQIPVFGNVYYLTTANPAARLMNEGKIPGCFVSDELLAAVRREKPAARLERAAAQVAMYRDLGAAGVDLGGLHDFEMLTRIAARAAEIGADWRAHRGLLDFPPFRLASGATPFYLYGGAAGRATSAGPAAGKTAAVQSQPQESTSNPSLSDSAPFRPSPRRRSFHQKHFDFLHRSFLTKGKCLNPAVTGTARAFKSLDRGDGFIYRLIHGAEKASKSFLFKCEDCGDCFLPENFGYCTLGECEKGLPNPPCGDATPDGFCGNNLKRICVAESIYNAAAAAISRSQSEIQAHIPAPAAPGLAATSGLAGLASTTLPSRLPELANTSAVLNYLFDRDHTQAAPLIQIAELLHASIPRTAAAMLEVIGQGIINRGQVTQLPNSDNPAGEDRELSNLAPNSSAALGYLISLIKMQARHGAAYIDVNVDALSNDDLEFRKEILRFFVRLIREHGEGVPVCVDSGSPDMLEAGLAAWHERTDSGSSESQPSGAAGSPSTGAANTIPGGAPVLAASSAVPLLNSVKTYTMERLLPLRAKYPFKFIGLLVDEKTAGRDGAYGVDELLGLAREIFQAATGRFGFAPSDIFFDSTVFPLSIDVPMDAEKPGFTYRAFETIRRIKNDPAFSGVHLSLGVTNSVRDLPGRRTGVSRAYLALAMARGLDAGIVNVFHEYGKRPAAPDLVEFVEAFVRQDGTPAAVQKALDAMMDFCRANRKK